MKFEHENFEISKIWVFTRFKLKTKFEFCFLFSLGTIDFGLHLWILKTERTEQLNTP